jgi:hypothetical protein
MDRLIKHLRTFVKLLGAVGISDTEITISIVRFQRLAIELCGYHLRFRNVETLVLASIVCSLPAGRGVTDLEQLGTRLLPITFRVAQSFFSRTRRTCHGDFTGPGAGDSRCKTQSYAYHAFHGCDLHSYLLDKQPSCKKSPLKIYSTTNEVGP